MALIMILAPRRPPHSCLRAKRLLRVFSLPIPSPFHFFHRARELFFCFCLASSLVINQSLSVWHKLTAVRGILLRPVAFDALSPVWFALIHAPDSFVGESSRL